MPPPSLPADAAAAVATVVKFPITSISTCMRWANPVAAASSAQSAFANLTASWSTRSIAATSAHKACVSRSVASPPLVSAVVS